MRLKRYSANPIITPSQNWWEVQATFNCGVAFFNGKIVLLYRAIGGDGLSRFGLASSTDGSTFQRLSEPAFEAAPKNSDERLGVEDPRITKINQTYYITYTAASVYPALAFKNKKFAPSLNHPAPWRVRPALAATSDFKNFERKGILLDAETKDAILFPEKLQGRFALLHRIYPNIYLTFSPDLKTWQDQSILVSPREGFWDSERVGGGAPPIKTDRGWLLFYHAVNQEHVYKLGLLLLDLADPSKVLYRSEEPILEPEEPYEKEGLTPNVVFTCGAIEKDDQYLVYYGAADRVIGLATLAKKEIENFKL